jgi:Holliday junction resolvase
MGKINSKKKGAAGEREFANLCKAEGFNVRRTQQYCGNTGDASDCVGLEGIHIEVKRVEALNIEKAMDQARNDCKGESLPIVAHRKNKTKWKITMDAEDWFKIYKEYWGGLREVE